MREDDTARWKMKAHTVAAAVACNRDVAVRKQIRIRTALPEGRIPNLLECRHPNPGSFITLSRCQCREILADERMIESRLEPLVELLVQLNRRRVKPTPSHLNRIEAKLRPNSISRTLERRRA